MSRVRYTTKSSSALVNRPDSSPHRRYGPLHFLCNFPSDDKDKVEALKKGDQAKITGKFSYYSGSDKRADLITCSLAK